MKKNCYVGVLLFSLFLPLVIFSQERLIPIDSTNNIKIINKKLEKSLNLFPEYSNFEEAKLFQKGDTSYILEIYYVDKGELVKDRKDISYSQLTELREKIREVILSKSLKLNINQEGRPLFVAGITGLSIYYGAGLAANIKGSGYYLEDIIIPMTVGAGFFTPFFLTMNKEVTKGMSYLAIGSGGLGIFYGEVLNDIVGIPWSKPKKYILPTITSLSGLVGGYYYAKFKKISEGKAKSIVYLSGLGAGLTTFIIDVDNDATYNQEIQGILYGGVGGALLGYFLSNKINFAPGDAGVFSINTLLASAETAVILNVTNVFDDGLVRASLSLGAALGGLRGGILVNKYDFSNAQANYLAFATTGGALIGAGLSSLLFKNYNVTQIITMLFGELGYDITLLAITKQKRKNEDMSEKLNLHLNPFALIYKSNEMGKTTFNQIPFLTISYRW